jgi:hypothetical protein
LPLELRKLTQNLFEPFNDGFGGILQGEIGIRISRGIEHRVGIAHRRAQHELGAGFPHNDAELDAGDRSKARDRLQLIKAPRPDLQLGQQSRACCFPVTKITVRTTNGNRGLEKRIKLRLLNAADIMLNPMQLGGSASGPVLGALHCLGEKAAMIGLVRLLRLQLSLLSAQSWKLVGGIEKRELARMGFAPVLPSAFLCLTSSHESPRLRLADAQIRVGKRGFAFGERGIFESAPVFSTLGIVLNDDGFGKDVSHVIGNARAGHCDQIEDRRGHAHHSEEPISSIVNHAEQNKNFYRALPPYAPIRTQHPRHRACWHRTRDRFSAHSLKVDTLFMPTSG